MASKRTSRSQQGFVLVLTLWVLAAIAIVAAYVAERSHAVLASTESQLREADAMLSMSDARNELLYRYTTTPMSFFGLGLDDRAIRLDDTPYAYDDLTMLQIQDTRGLVNVNRASDQELERLLRLYGVPVQKQEPLINKLRDYIDEDDFVRLNGAEKDQYQAAGLPPPRNTQLATPEELIRVLGWRDLPEVRDNHRLIEQLTIKGGGFNPNTATRDLLLTLPGMTNAGADAVIAQRAIQPLNGPSDLAAIAQLPPSGAFLAMPFPADTFRLTLSAKQVNWMLRYNVTLTPYSGQAPWQIDYALRLPKPAPIVAPTADAPNETAQAKPVPPPTPLPPRVDVPIDLSSPLLTSH